jgi:hypothetical protein
MAKLYVVSSFTVLLASVVVLVVETLPKYRLESRYLCYTSAGLKLGASCPDLPSVRCSASLDLPLVHSAIPTMHSAIPTMHSAIPTCIPPTLSKGVCICFGPCPPVADARVVAGVATNTPKAVSNIRCTSVAIVIPLVLVLVLVLVALYAWCC